MNDDLIYRQAVMVSLAKEYNRRRTDGGLKLAWIEKAVNEVPPEEPKRGKGLWIRPDRKHSYERFCSECQKKAWYCGKDDYPFCPWCGADMRGEERREDG